MSTNLFEICPNIEELYLYANFSNVCFDSLCNLKKLKLYGYLLDGFNFDLFENICSQLEELSIKFENMNDESIVKLLYGRNFAELSTLRISYSDITKLEKKLFDGFPMLQSLKVSKNPKLKTIDLNAFSNLKNLMYLNLNSNLNWILSCFQASLISILLYLKDDDKYSNIEGFSYPVKITYFLKQ